MKDVILEQYQVRKSNPEKTRFIAYLKNRLSAFGYDPETDITIEEKGKGIFNSRNIVVGNPSTAKILMCAHYDTCAVLPFPNFMSPTNPVLFILSQVMITCLIFILTFLFAFLVTWPLGDAFLTYWAFVIFLYVFLFYMTQLIVEFVYA